MVEPVELTEQEKRVAASLAALATETNLSPGALQAMRQIARSEIASLAGLVLRRLQEPHPTRSFDRNAADDIVRERLTAIFGEALADFSGQTGQGDAPGA